MSSANTAIIRRFALLEHNPRVREFFRNIDDATAQRLETGRALARQACLVDDQDTIDIIQFKMWLFADYIAREDTPYYAIPIARFHSESNEFKPQCMLYFQGNREDEDGDLGLMSAEISFRLFWAENEVTQPRINALARDIKSQFATPRYKWRKGTEVITYYKPVDGLELRLYASSLAEGERVIRDVCRLADKTYDDNCLNQSQRPKRTFPVNPGTEVVLGKTQRKRRRRPVGEVQFEYAQFSWHKLTKPIILVSTGYKFRRSLEYAAPQV